MKSIFYAYTFFFSVSALAQTNYVSTYLDNPNIYAAQLHQLPWDESRLVQYRETVGSANLTYEIEEVTNSTISPVIPPQCSAINRPPVLVQDGYLIVGTTSQGNELLYFNEVNSTVFDLNMGIDGSDPEIWEKGGRLFVIAFDGAFRQLYEFDEATHAVTQITNNSISVNSVCAVWGDDVYYSTKYVNTLTGLDEYTLIKAAPTSGAYSHTFIQNIHIPSSMDHQVDWKSPQLMWGKLYMAAVDASVYINNSNTMGVMVVDPNDQVSAANITLPNFVGEFYLVEWDGKLVVYSPGHDQMFISSDGTSFSSVDVPVNGRLVECTVSENDQLYFICMYPDESREIFQYDNGFESKYAGDHIHFLSEQEGVVYASDFVDGDSSSILLVYTTMDVVDEVKMHPTFHSPYYNSSLMYNGMFTFLFGTDSVYGEHDIFQLTGSPSAGLDELTNDVIVYPNPVQSGAPVFIETDGEGEARLITVEGQQMTQYDLVPGTNTIDVSTLPSGVYLILFDNRAHRIVIN